MNIIFIILGLALAAAAYFILRKNLKLVKEGVETMAKIIDIKQEWSTDEDGFQTKSYYPILEFITDKNETYSFKGNIGSSSERKHQIGGEVKIVYHPDDPAKAQVKAATTLWLMPGLLFVVGLVLIIAGLGA